MRNSHPKPNGWVNCVPTADASLRESVVRVTANRPGTWGFALAEVRACRKWSLATQAMALGVSESALVFLSVCRLPRPGCREEDVVVVANRMGIQVATLWFILDLAAEATCTNRRVVAEGAA
ncbi:MAG: hypothetical protein C0467_29285 [Planctomycetaceae bacterium]|nr:hypothetical protein [Planctomycetaceae bacterium]